MRKIKQLEEKINKISEAIGIEWWEEVEEDDQGSPPTFWDRKTYKARYPVRTLSPAQAMKLLLDYLGVEIEQLPSVCPPYAIVKKKKKK